MVALQNGSQTARVGTLTTDHRDRESTTLGRQVGEDRLMVIRPPLDDVGGEHPLVLPLRKVAAAKRSLRAYVDEWQDYLDTEGLAIEKVVNAELHAIEFQVRLHRRAPLGSLESKLRSCVQDSRSALDNLVHAIGVACGASDSALRKNSFPVVRQSKEWAKTAKQRLGGLPADVVGRVSAVQPFAHTPLSWPPHPLDLLSVMSNADKHRDGIRLAVRPSFPEGQVQIGEAQFVVETSAHKEALEDFGGPDEVLDLDMRTIVDGAVLFRVRFPRVAELGLVEAKLKDFPIAPVAIVQGEDRRGPLIPAMENCVRWVRETVLYVHGGGDCAPDPAPRTSRMPQWLDASSGGSRDGRDEQSARTSGFGLPLAPL